ncbi:hypothetical protein FZC84_11880 [Rossellomorea vietnamensis]|uniref:Siphovirus-type tail component C-terminal domain-containing protein n=1 Tax=Rossellomorea vietnamensis TaxID=218284 RepID=A0A5D4MAT7_9BACI|nr:distal tail protein Dit [Rossellomorea vietnamensis]TYR99069.1 hypothetical protein FZC84_11880 [Rossellomorea vietnamensis]
MYEFTKLTEPGTQSTFLSIQTVFNGNNLDELLSDENGSFTTLTVSGRSNLINRINTVEVAGLEGLLESEEHSISEKEITVKYRVSDKTNEGFRKRCNQLNGLLIGAKKELEFSDEEAVFFATLSSNIIPEEDSNNLVGTITFLCSNPHKYHKLSLATIESDLFSVTCNGSASAYPIIRATVKEPITHFDIISEQGYMRLGEPLSLEEIPAEREQLILHDTMQTTTGWATSAAGIIDGAVSGQMLADTYRFYVNDYGTGAGWHGPARTKTVSQIPLTDFRIEAVVELLNTNRLNNGRIEIYLLNDLLEVVGKMAMKNVDRGSNRNYGEIRIGNSTINHKLIEEFGATESTWENFYGLLRLQRNGTKWEAYIAQIDKDTGVHTSRKYVAFEDFDDQFSKDVSAVAVHLGKYGTNSVTTNRIYDLKVFKVNNLTENQIPYIAYPGDLIEIDFSKSKILINGEDRKDLKDFGSRYFPLVPGVNILQIAPFTSLENIEIEWRDRFK